MQRRKPNKIQIHTNQKKDYEKELPIVHVDLLSPTSVSMKNTLLVRNGSFFESFIRNQQRMKTASKEQLKNKILNLMVHEDAEKSGTEREETPEARLLLNKYLVANKRPAARDGHSGLSLMCDEKPYMLVFGGDRHHMPFNDCFLLDLECELF